MESDEDARPGDRRVGVGRIGERLGDTGPDAQLRFYTGAGEFGIEAADNPAGRAVLNGPVVAAEVQASQGVLVAKLHPVERPRVV